MGNSPYKTKTFEIEESLLSESHKDLILNQLNSINDFVVDGEDKFGKKLSSDLINHCLNFEDKIGKSGQLKVLGNFTNSQPSYTIYRVRKNPIQDQGFDLLNNYYKVLDVNPRIVEGRFGYYVRDFRLFSPTLGVLKGKFLSWEELLIQIHRNDYGMDIIEYMRIKGLQSFSFEDTSELNQEEVISFEL